MKRGKGPPEYPVRPTSRRVRIGLTREPYSVSCATCDDSSCFCPVVRGGGRRTSPSHFAVVSPSEPDTITNRTADRSLERHHSHTVSGLDAGTQRSPFPLSILSTQAIQTASLIRRLSRVVPDDGIQAPQVLVFSCFCGQVHVTHLE